MAINEKKLPDRKDEEREGGERERKVWSLHRSVNLNRKHLGFRQASPTFLSANSSVAVHKLITKKELVINKTENLRCNIGSLVGKHVSAKRRQTFLRHNAPWLLLKAISPSHSLSVALALFMLQ